jgi:hypothetical protein
MATQFPYLKFAMSQSASAIKYIVFSFKSNPITSNETLTMFTMKVNSSLYKIKLSKGTNTTTNKNNNKLKIYQNIAGIDQENTDVLLYQLNSQAPANSFEYKAGDSQWTIVAIKFPPAPSSSSFKDSYFQINSANTCTITLGHFAYYANNNNEAKQYFQYNYWDDINNAQWYQYQYTNNQTWQDVYYSILNAKSIDNIQTLFNTFAGNDVINQTTIVYEESDFGLLNIAINPEFRIYVDISKKTISQIPV